MLTLMSVIAGVVFVVCWVCIIYEIKNAPLMDDNGLYEIKRNNRPKIGDTWNCSCGALNASYNSKCGRCETIKPTGKWDQKTKHIN
jgi:hypothetical protein